MHFAQWHCMDSLPEIFHVQFLDGRKGYAGRADFALEQPEIRRLCHLLHQDVNASLIEQTGRMLGAPKRLYFDIIKSDHVNASSKACSDELYLIGVTQAMVSRVREVLLHLTSQEHLYSVLRIDASPADPADDSGHSVHQELRDQLFLLVFLFATNHELGHHVHGHTSVVGSALESEGLNGLKTSQIRQAMEVDADGYAIFASLNTLYSPEWLQKLADLFPQGASERAGIERMWMLMVFLAAAVYLDANAPKDVNWKDMGATDYPPYFLRLEYLLGHIEGWCDLNRPHLAHVLDGSTVKTLLDLASTAWVSENENREITLAKELSRSDESSYHKHIEDLQAWRHAVRETLKPHVWIVRGYAGADTT